MDEPITRVPPHSLEAEQSVLGSMLLDKEAVATAFEFLNADDFYVDAHREIFDAILNIYDRGAPVDLITLIEELRQRGTIEAVGGTKYITDLSMTVPSTANIGFYIKIIEEKSILRKLIKASSEIVKDSYVAQEDVDIILDNAEKKIFDILQRKSTRDFESIKTVLLETYSKIEDMSRNKGKIIGVPTGFIDFDQRTSGLQPSDFVLIAARPSMGKTTFALNIAQYAAVREKVPVAIFSLEMAKDQLVQRMLSAESNVELQKIRTGELDEEDWLKLVQAAGPLSQAPIFIDDTPGMSVMEIRSKARRLKLEHGLGMIVIDYLQLMSGRGKTESRQQEISEISRSLKALARELDVPVVTLSQLSRAPEARTDHRPMLSDLRESGAIEQDADVVVFLYRDEYYNPDSEKKNIAEVIISKQRNGPTGTLELVWLGQFTKFVNYERSRQES
ncbi:MAG: replicative DNA helicase [Xylanivirga thermophila]|jgi:replicative DNA helicase|uniref:replicative DNA helicase n=1 Tax=Xylanivirga thermophila TaxID=2496273 RepID=UPI00101C00F2|nr:replicative DNA helicase [Xylanivirga thermophila]